MFKVESAETAGRITFQNDGPHSAFINPHPPRFSFENGMFKAKIQRL